MEASTLLDNLNSDYLSAFSALQPKQAPSRVLVYVEGYEDIPFWQALLRPFEQNKRKFDIQLPSRDNLNKGKPQVLKHYGNVGPNLILCVDSDYDYWRGDTTEMARQINGSPYVFQTYVYSIENFQCYAPSLVQVFTQASKTSEELLDWEGLMCHYSEVIRPLFLWSLYFGLQGDTTSFTIEAFCAEIKILSLKNGLDQALSDLKAKVEAKCQALGLAHPNAGSELEALAQKLESGGCPPNQTYLFANGHTIKDNVVLMVLKHFVEQSKKAQIATIKGIAKHGEELGNQVKQYTGLVLDPEQALSLNSAYEACSWYQKIIQDLEAYVAKT